MNKKYTHIYIYFFPDDDRSNSNGLIWFNLHIYVRYVCVYIYIPNVNLNTYYFSHTFFFLSFMFACWFFFFPLWMYWVTKFSFEHTTQISFYSILAELIVIFLIIHMNVISNSFSFFLEQVMRTVNSVQTPGLKIAGYS